MLTMPYRETNARMSGRITGKSFGVWIAGAALLCTLSSAQLSLAAQQVLTQPNAVRQALAQGTQPAPAKAAAPQGQSQQPAPKPAPAKPGLANSTPAKPGQSTAKPLANPISKAIAKPAAVHESTSRRDPFSALVGGPAAGGGVPTNLPPGKAGLVISRVRIDGIVKGPGGMIAVVTNGQERTYFLREGDQLYDGSVTHITMTDVAFHETGKDPFGKPVEREVSKPLNATPGEQQ
jgi:hypothetical protein